MFPPPKRDNGLKETELCYATKKLWAIVCYYELYKPPTFEYFIKNIQDYIEKYEIEWPEPKKGKDKYPKYATAKEWPSKYNYEECVQHFENYKLHYDSNNVNNIFDKKYGIDSLSDFENYDSYNDAIQKELAKDNPDFRKIVVLENLKDKAFTRINKRSGRDVNRFEGSVNLNSDVTVNLLDKVKQKRRELNELRSNKE